MQTIKSAQKGLIEKKNKKIFDDYQKKLDVQIAKFSTTLDKDYYDEAMKIRKNMKKDQRFKGFDEPKFNVNTVNIFKRQFTFP